MPTCARHDFNSEDEDCCALAVRWYRLSPSVICVWYICGCGCVILKPIINKPLTQTMPTQSMVAPTQPSNMSTHSKIMPTHPTVMPAQHDTGLQPIGSGATISAPHMHAHCLDILEQHLTPGGEGEAMGVCGGVLFGWPGQGQVCRV